MAERSEAKSAKRSFASKYFKFYFWREASLRASCFAALSFFNPLFCSNKRQIDHYSRDNSRNIYNKNDAIIFSQQSGHQPYSCNGPWVFEQMKTISWLVDDWRHSLFLRGSLLLLLSLLLRIRAALHKI